MAWKDDLIKYRRERAVETLEAEKYIIELEKCIDKEMAVKLHEVHEEKR